MTTTPRIGAPVLEEGQATPETTVNEITRYLEAVAARVVVDKDRTAPAGTEADGDCFIVPASPTGAWTGKAGYIAVKVSTAWVFIAPFAGLTFFVQDEAVNYRYSGSAWAAVAGGGTAASLDYDTDVTLAANSDSKLATQKAVKAFVAANVAGLFDLKGSTDCSANPNYPAANKGDAYVVSVAGKIGGASGTSVDAGDVYVASADNAGGTQASVGASWFVLEHNMAATTVGGNLFSLANPSAITFIRINADNSISALSASAFRTAIGAGTGTGTGDMIAANNLSDVLSIIASVDHLFTKGTDIASAGTTDLSTATGNFVDVTGTTTITALGTLAAGAERTVRFTGALTLTYNATSLILPTAANIVTVAGDIARFRSLGSGNWVCVAYQRASGQPLAPSTQYYRIGFFFTTTPAVSEVIAIHPVTDAFTLPANFASPDSKGACGTNPTASFVLDVQRSLAASPTSFSSIGTITISTGGAFTFATASGTSKSIAAGDVIKIVAPSPVDATCANVAVTLKGSM